MLREETSAALLFLPGLLDVQVAQYDGAQTAQNCGADSALDVLVVRRSVKDYTGIIRAAFKHDQQSSTREREGYCTLAWQHTDA